jgi:hypothetical protein
MVFVLQMPTQLGRRTEEECSAKLAQGVPFGPINPSEEIPERDRDADLCRVSVHFTRNLPNVQQCILVVLW